MDWKEHKKTCIGLEKNKPKVLEVVKLPWDEADAALSSYREALRKKAVSPSQYVGKG